MGHAGAAFKAARGGLIERFSMRYGRMMALRCSLLVALVVLVSSVGLAGCGNDDESAAPRETTPSTLLDGTYAMTVAANEPTKSGGAEPGRWTINIDSGDASLDGPENRHIPLTPTELSETRMVVPADPGCPNNDPSPGEGEYEVELRGEVLRFTKVRDPCGDRAFTLTVHDWRRAAP